MCIYVIYKCLSWDFDQKQDLGKPSLKYQAKSLAGKSCWASYPTWWVKRFNLLLGRGKDGLICCGADNTWLLKYVKNNVLAKKQI